MMIEIDIKKSLHLRIGEKCIVNDFFVSVSCVCNNSALPQPLYTWYTKTKNRTTKEHQKNRCLKLKFQSECELNAEYGEKRNILKCRIAFYTSFQLKIHAHITRIIYIVYRADSCAKKLSNFIGFHGRSLCDFIHLQIVDWCIRIRLFIARIRCACVYKMWCKTIFRTWKNRTQRGKSSLLLVRRFFFFISFLFNIDVCVYVSSCCLLSPFLHSFVLFFFSLHFFFSVFHFVNVQSVYNFIVAAWFVVEMCAFPIAHALIHRHMAERPIIPMVLVRRHIFGHTRLQSTAYTDTNIIAIQL